MKLVLPAALLGLSALGACGGSSNPPPPQSPEPGPGDVIQISGGERLGWAQHADSITNLHFAVYVDNNRVELPASVCRASTPGLLDCVSPLPPLTPGRHALEMVSVVGANGLIAESSRAPALNVNVTGIGPSASDVPLTASSQPPGSPRSPARASPGCGLTALAPQGFAMWDETGVIRTFDRQAAPSRTLAWKTDPHWTLSGVAAHPKFAENRMVYLVEIPVSREPVLRLSRYREVGGVLGERAVLLETRVDTPFDRTSVSFGDDGYLSIALLSSLHTPVDGHARHADRFLLRVTDGGAPAPGTQPGSVFAPMSAPIPIAVAWPRGGGTPWLLTQVTADAYAVTQPGQPEPVEHRLYPASVPVAMQLVGSGPEQVIYVTGTRGDIRRLGYEGTGWMLRDAFRLFDNAKSIRDALVLGDDEVAACGPVSGSRYGVWRVRLP